jgi:phage terminase large subunit-like protein
VSASPQRSPSPRSRATTPRRRLSSKSGGPATKRRWQRRGLITPLHQRDRATDYARRVLLGEIRACRYVKLACLRHMRDRRRKDLRWDPEAAELAIDFFSEVLRLPDDGGAGDPGDGDSLAVEGRPFHLSGHQCFYVGQLFGWKRPDGRLRFEVVYIEEPKGSGKSPTLAGILLKSVAADRVRGAQCYAAAAKKDQAMLLVRDADAMRVVSPELRDRLTPSGGFPHVWQLACDALRSFLRAISSEDAQSGPRVYRAGIDEVHEHRTATVVDKVIAGLKGKWNAFAAMITNSGFDRTSVCYRERKYSLEVLEGALQDDARLVFITGLDVCEDCRRKGREFPADDCEQCDDWRDESVWPKAAPNLGVTVSYDYYRRQVREAIGMPTKANMVKRLLFCIWTEGQERWLPLEDWLACKRPELCRLELLKGRRCFAGIDLGGTSDLAAVVLHFPPIGERDPAIIIPFFFMAKASIEERTKKDRVPYDQWVKDGLIEATDGNVTDYGAIRAKLKWLREEYGLVIVELPIDPDDATQLSSELVEDAFLPVLFYQTKRNYTPAVNEGEKLIASRGIAHGNHAVMNFCVSNGIMERNKQNQVKPIKGKDREKNDGLVAWLMALGRAILQITTVPTADSATGYML